MSNALEKLRQHYQERDLAPRGWKARGRKVVGYICNAVPEELIWAAGMMPVRLAGTPGGETEDITSVFNVNKYTEGFVNTMLNDLMTGKYDYLDYLVLPHNSRNTIQTQYSHLHIIRELWPDTNKLPELYFIEEFQSWAHNSVEYHYETLKEFAAQLEAWSGYPISPRRLDDAIKMCNKTRELVGQVQKLRDEQKMMGMIATLLTGAYVFQRLMTLSGLPSALSDFILSVDANRYVVMAIIIVVYIMFGMFSDINAAILITVPIVCPIVTGALGFDGLWFGVVIVSLIELGAISPPLGMNVFTLAGITGIPATKIFKASVPYMVCILLLMVILVAFPQLAMIIPYSM